MTIEFRCPTCDKLLRTSDEKAGARAKCPECGNSVTVPAAGGGPVDDFSIPEDDYGAGAPGGFDSAFGSSPGSHSAPTQQLGTPGHGSDAMKNCPMCGAEIRAAAIKCRYCGEVLGGAPGAVPGRHFPTQIDSGEVLSTAWQIFKANMGICIGGVVLVWFMNQIAQWVAQFVLMGVMMAAGGRGGPNPAAMVIGLIVFIVLVVGVSLFFQAGQHILFLNIARGTNPDIGNVFSGGSFVFRLFLNSFIMGIIVFIGFILLIVPGILLLLMFWPYIYSLVDEDSPGLGALGRAKEITEGNWGAVFVLWLAVVGINILGALACLIGLLFSIPYTVLIFAVAYCRMTGQPTAAD